LHKHGACPDLPSELPTDNPTSAAI
jgi:hypothetical protein